MATVHFRSTCPSVAKLHTPKIMEITTAAIHYYFYICTYTLEGRSAHTLEIFQTEKCFLRLSNDWLILIYYVIISRLLDLSEFRAIFAVNKKDNKIFTENSSVVVLPRLNF